MFSSQRGGLRNRSTAAVAGNTLTWAPAAYAFQPGETVQVSVTCAAASAGGSMAIPRVQRFTAAAGGTGLGLFPGGSEVFRTDISDVASGDVDGDGDLDLVVANGSANVAHVVLNGGNASGSNTGTFSGTPQNVPVGIAPVAVVLADVDGDGDLDLLTANFASNTASVRLNGGNASGSNTGVFASGQTVTVGTTPRHVAVGDVDGDGDLDLATANTGDHTVSVRLNGGDSTGAGTGLFANGTDVRVGFEPTGVALADVDGDGDLDLLSANYTGGSVSVRRNDGNARGVTPGTFSGTQELSTGSYCTKLVVGDVNGDGALDLLASSGIGNNSTVHVLLNAGGTSGAFASARGYAVTGPARTLALGDVDGDGDLDAVAATGTSALTVLRNGSGKGPGSAGTFGTTQAVGVGGLAQAVALADVDGDGDLDLLTANTVGSMTSVRLNQGGAPAPTLRVTGDTLVCAGGQVRLTAASSSAVTAYRWSTGATTADLVVTLPGLYDVTATFSRGFTSTASYRVRSFAPSVAIVGDTVRCPVRAVQLSARAPGATALRWSTGDSTASIVVPGPGTYRLTAFYGAGCQAQASLMGARAWCFPTSSPPTGTAGASDLSSRGCRPKVLR